MNHQMIVKGLNAGLKILKRRIVDLSHDHSPLFVYLAGSTGSGKTHVTNQLSGYLDLDITILPLDDYYLDASLMKVEKNGFINWDTPDSLDLPNIKRDLELLRQSKDILKPIYDMALSKCIGYEPLLAKNIIVVDGAHALNDDIVDSPSVKVYVEAKESIRLNRKLKRDFHVRKKGEADFIRRYFYETSLPTHEIFIYPTKKNADIIIENNQTR